MATGPTSAGGSVCRPPSIPVTLDRVAPMAAETLPQTRPPSPALPPVVQVDGGSVDQAAGDRQSRDSSLVRLVRVLHRRRTTALLTAGAVTLLGGLVTLQRRLVSPLYQGGFTLLIADPVNEAGAAAPVSEGGGTSLEALARNAMRNDVPTLIRVLQSPAVLGPVDDALRARGITELPTVKVTLQAADPDQKTPILASGVLGVQAVGRDPQVLQLTLGLAQQQMLGWALEQRRAKLAQGVRFLDQQAPVLQQKSDRLQQELERFRTVHGVIQPEQEATTLRGQLEAVRNRAIALQADQARLLELREQVRRGNLTARAFIDSPTDGNRNGGVGLDNQPLLDQLTKVEQQLAETRAQFRDDSLQVRSLMATRDQLRPLVHRKELQALDTALRLNAQALRASIGQQRQLAVEFRRLPSLLRAYESINQRLRVAQGNVESYLRTREQFQLEIAQKNMPWKVIVPAVVNPEPVEPKLSRGLLQSLALGLVAGAGAALVRDRLDTALQDPEEARRALALPLLGHVPCQGTGNHQDAEAFAQQEALRELASSLRFLDGAGSRRCLGITSALPAEGKSHVSLLLARTLAELGQRVLLVDADLRRPQLHQRLGLSNSRGLTTLLGAEPPDLFQVLQPVPGLDALALLAAGPLPQDPPRLLGSAALPALVHRLADSALFDVVLYDLPPVLGLADTSLLAGHLDGVMLLVSLGQVPRKRAQAALERLQEARASVLGMITNRLRPSATDADRHPTYRYYTNAAPAGASSDLRERFRRWLEG